MFLSTHLFLESRSLSPVLVRPLASLALAGVMCHGEVILSHDAIGDPYLKVVIADRYSPKDRYPSIGPV